ncbi:uncharacterized protein OCT59_028734 [Rhizophagus irregularis]|uniref:F-box domain-containing protein n=2 Tax=Rhizophagus irregularis TaxID=588596 RepID=A0A015IM08_RHIIW|nr:hypothetical protein RirG_227330 [Rhizophagus irregularis DAOM 197198w]UZO08480.1 hypothetical protein OCT59_028734 [Rhizophagus irregularis]GBC52639.1 hypothetical protein GLOIN_2v1784405 [Rhizophagus irregularis DAOM 181602=DAOM 197198]
MPRQLLADCLKDIFEYLYDDKNTLYSCLLVNHLCCEIAVRILWRDVRKFYDYNDTPHIPISIIYTLIACLPKESEEILHKNGINITIPIQKPPLFNYASFCKVISIYRINDMLKYTLEKQQSNISKDLQNLILQEILKMLMNQISSLKALKYNVYISHSEDIDVLSIAKIHLANLVELKCDSDICSEFISQISHNLQSLTIDFKPNISNRLLDLIFSQNNLKIVNLRNFQDYNYRIFISSLTKQSLILTKLTLKNCKISIPFIAMFKNLQELILNQKNGEYTFYQLQDAHFSQLKILKISIYDDDSDVDLLINFLEINGKNLTEFYIYHYHNESINIALADFCPNLKILCTQIKENEEEIFKLILNNCKYLEIIEYRSGFDDLFYFFEILANYSRKYFYGLILEYFAGSSIDAIYDDLEGFFINWQDRTSQRPLSLIISITDCVYNYSTRSKNDIKILVKEYMELGIKIQKFEIKKIPFCKSM